MINPPPESDGDMSKPTTERYKPRGIWTVAEHLEYERSGTWPLSDEYRALRAKVLADAGLEDDIDDASVPIADMTPEQHLSRIRRDR